MLSVSGVGSVKIDLLARQIGVSRGSFYWHFGCRQDLLDALLSDWEARNQHEIAEAADYLAASQPLTPPIVALLQTKRALPSFDMAVRIWARKSASVRRAVRHVDDAWVALLQSAFSDAGYGKNEAFVRARVTYFYGIGCQALSDAAVFEDGTIASMHQVVLTGRKSSGGDT